MLLVVCDELTGRRSPDLKSTEQPLENLGSTMQPHCLDASKLRCRPGDEILYLTSALTNPPSSSPASHI